MRKIFYFILLLISSNTFSQNLMLNPSFEQYIICPDNYSTPGNDELSGCLGWSSFRNTPDYFNTCATLGSVAPPICCWLGFQYPHSGNSFSGIITYDYYSLFREFIGSQLLTPVSLGQRYFISFYINLGGSNQLNYTTIASNKIGVKFSTVPFSYFNPAPINNTAHFYTDSIITDTVKWTKIKGSFIADSAYSYIIIGNFFDDNNTDTINLEPTNNNYAYYYIDDVCVSADSLYCENWLGVKEQSIKKEEIVVYPNPCTNQLNVHVNKVQSGSATISLLDITGKIMLQNITTDNEISFNSEQLAKGLYLVKVESGGVITLTKFTKE